ncbi:MAG: hypothetical protein WAN30_05050 [Acidimicrobiales bacterium]
MLATVSTLALVPLVVSVGIWVPLLGLHLELAHRREQRHQREVRAQSDLIDDYAATIDAYRRAMALEMSDLARSSVSTDSSANRRR